ncbi:MAG: DCC1-like thiol-disulfide oxidoreductase family protein [Myxococcota bacterium]
MLTVYYDSGCPFCRRCRASLEARPQFTALRFVPATSAPRLPGNGTELTVVASDGAYWTGADAFLVCLWALEDTRAVSLWMATPWVRPLARWFFRTLSNQRHLLAIFGDGERCDGHCGVPPRHLYR